MKKFYVCKGGLAKGPFTIEKLAERGIDESDPVWCAGFKECRPAVRVRELQTIFEHHQPRTSGTVASQPPQGYVLYKNNSNKYSRLFACSLVAGAALLIYYILTVLTW